MGCIKTQELGSSVKITIVSGSRADAGLLEWPIKTLQDDPFFQGQILKIWGATFDSAFAACTESFTKERPDLVLILGDRFEILAAATAAHLLRVPIAHIGGGDVTEGSYDDAMRDAISRMASLHFVTSTSAMARLSHHGYRNIHLVGNPGIDYIRHADWRRERPIAESYVVVSYQAETLSDDFEMGQEISRYFFALPSGIKRVFIRANPDRGSDFINALYDELPPGDVVHDFLPHAEFLNLLAHCEEFIGNSSAMLYEAPELGIKTRMIGRRQKGRTLPWGDGFASERMANLLKRIAL